MHLVTVSAFIVLLVVVVPDAQGQATSCLGRCAGGYHPEQPCQCNEACLNNNDCCDDFIDICHSCETRCNAPYDALNFCQCNDRCQDFGNCCDDYSDFCGGSSGGDVLRNISQVLFEIDLANNNMGGRYTLNLNQGSCSNNCCGDTAPGPMFSSFQDSNFDGPTTSLFRNFFNNYNPSTSVAEDHTQAEQDEENAFLSLVMDTAVMTEAYNFLVRQNVFVGTKQEFQAKLYEMWFEPYDRSTSGSTLASSGFEHVFMGEQKSGDVSGYHNWLKYYSDESEGAIDFRGTLTSVSFGEGGDGVTNVYDWDGFEKCIGGFFVGTSPELDMAVKSICWLMRAGSDCFMEYNGVSFNIKTYSLTYNGKPHVATAYPVF